MTDTKISTERRQMVHAIMMAMQGHDFGSPHHETGNFTCSAAQIDLLEHCCNDAVDRLLASRQPVNEPADVIEAALVARVPGGSQVWHWIDGGGMTITETHRSVMRTILETLRTYAAPQPAPVVTDEMVERAVVAHDGGKPDGKATSLSYTDHNRMKRALTAALTKQEGSATLSGGEE